MNVRQQYTIDVVARDWREKMAENYKFFKARAESWEREMSKQRDPAQMRAAGAVRDHHAYVAEGLLLALDALGYTFDGERVVAKGRCCLCEATEDSR